MDFNTFLLRFGLNPDDFENKLLEPIHEGNNFIYKVDQKITTRDCCKWQNRFVGKGDADKILNKRRSYVSIKNYRKIT